MDICTHQKIYYSEYEVMISLSSFLLVVLTNLPTSQSYNHTA
jgi:hypothetical protein